MGLIRMTIELEINNYAIDLTDKEECDWIRNEILVGNGKLILHSNEIGDYLGVISKVSNIVILKTQ